MQRAVALTADQIPGLVLLIGLALIVVTGIVIGVRCYARCPPGQLLVVHGKLSGGRLFVVLKEGGRFVWPIVQSHSSLSLEPIAVRDARGEPAAVRIGTDEQRMENAAIRRIGLPREEIASIAGRILEETGFPANRADTEEGLRAVGLELV